MKQLALIFALLLATSAHAADSTDTRLLGDPAVSANRIAFGYANDLWTANADGSGVQRLTAHMGVEYGPRFSPDGAHIAFTARYEGNTDVYVVPATGGVPKRLTWHPAADSVLGWTPDGKSVLFSSPREVHTRRHLQLFTVPAGGGAVTKLPIPSGVKGAYSPDGKKIAYVPLREAFQQWKNYRGGTAARIWVMDVASLAVEQIPQPAGRSNDTDPMWIGDRIYFRSDRNGEFNLFSYDPATKQVAQLTRFTDFPVLTASAGAGRIIFEQAGWLHSLDPRSGNTQRLKVAVAAELTETRPRYAKGAKFIRNYSLSPTGARAALEVRGEIITVPAEKGDDRNLTMSTGAHDRWPAWSPDGKSIAYFTDESGEYELRIAAQDGKGAARKIKIAGGAGYYEFPKWSPDGTKISFADNSHSIWVLDVASGAAAKVSSNVLYSPYKILDHSWSPDSKWLAYTRGTGTNLNVIHLYSVDQKKSFALTDGLSDSREPVFDPNGKYLWFLASTNAGPVNDWFSQWNADAIATSSIYLAVLPKGVASPLAKESDEEATTPVEQPAEKKEETSAKKPATVTIDFDSLAQRIQAVPLPAAVYSDLQIAKTGELFFLERPPVEPTSSDQPAAGKLMRFDLKKRKADTLSEGIGNYELSRDGKRVLVKLKDSWSIADVMDKLDVAKRKLAIDRIEVRVDPVAEWRQIYDEAWRINRDYFYDPNYHGADWKAMREKYAVFLPHVVTRQDLNRVMQWLHSELSVGHHRQTPGDIQTTTDTIPGGLLGADYKVENGRYRFATVYGGLNWNPDLRAPLTEPGVDVKEGEYLLAVEGKELRYPDNLYARFERTAGRFTEITVGPNADGTGSRTVRVVPIEDESNLRNRAWVENNIRKVQQATNNRVAYVYVPNTGGGGHEYFKRYFFPQADREAIIIDERYNGGGQVADYYIDILRRPYIAHWATRYGADLKTPLMSIQGPKVMIIDEDAGSGGDLLPYMFRKFNMGTIVGRRTWGGLVGILGFPELMDGAVMTAPNLAIWTDEGFIIENEGVAPDIEVEQTPADLAAGRDPQLDKAIEVVLKQLEQNPPPKMTRPAYPVRARR